MSNLSEGIRTLSTERWLAAAPERVWQAFADPHQLKRWWGPAGFSNEFQEFDFSEGGDWRFWMIGPDGKRYWNECRFITVLPCSRLVINHTVAPLFHLTISLTAQDHGTLLSWEQCFETAALCQALEAVCRPANEQNLDRLGLVLNPVP